MRALTVLGVCVFMNLLARGCGESFAVFLLPISGEMGWSRAEITSVYSVYMITHGLAAPFVGLVFDRLGGRLTYLMGLTCYALGFAIAARATELWQLYLALGLLGGIGLSSLGLIPAIGLIGRWFERRLTTAMAFAYAGLGLGVILVVPLAQWLIEDIGWRATYTAMATALIALAPLVAILPWRKFEAGNPLFYKPGAKGSNGALAVLKGAAATVPFWSLLGVFLFTAISLHCINVQTVAYFIEVGFEPLQAAGAFGVAGLLSIGGLVVTGLVVDKYGHRLVVTLIYGCTFVGLGFLWLLWSTPSVLVLAGFVLFHGASQGARGPIISALVARLFDRGVGAIYGTITVGFGLGAAIGSWASGALYDMTGDYRAGFILSAVTAAIGLAPFWLVRPLATGRR